jgi:hypothetical protein
MRALLVLSLIAGVETANPASAGHSPKHRDELYGLFAGFVYFFAADRRLADHCSPRSASR